MINKEKRNKYMCEYNKLYLKSRKGFIQRLYTKMKSRVTGSHKSHIKYYINKEIIPKDDFYNWINNHKDFDILFANWEQSC